MTESGQRLVWNPGDVSLETVIEHRFWDSCPRSPQLQSWVSGLSDAVLDQSECIDISSGGNFDGVSGNLLSILCSTRIGDMKATMTGHTQISFAQEWGMLKLYVVNLFVAGAGKPCQYVDFNVSNW